jgi:hypothetical protein
MAYTYNVDVVNGNNNNNNNNNNNGYKIHVTIKLPNLAELLSFTQKIAADLHSISRIPLQARQRLWEDI